MDLDAVFMDTTKAFDSYKIRLLEKAHQTDFIYSTMAWKASSSSKVTSQSHLKSPSVLSNAS